MNCFKVMKHGGFILHVFTRRVVTTPRVSGCLIHTCQKTIQLKRPVCISRGLACSVIDAHGTVCWNCGHEHVLFKVVCEKCSTIQECKDSVNLFTLLGIKQSFDIDEKRLPTSFKQLQAVLHPDKFSQRSKKEQELSENLSSLVNRAYQTLSDPLERALYLLKLHDVVIDEATKQGDQQFLMEVMEINEKLDSCNEPRELEQIRADSIQHFQDYVKKFSEEYGSNNLSSSEKIAAKMKYYRNIIKLVKEKELKLGVVR